jgi:hypothetical protein
LKVLIHFVFCFAQKFSKWFVKKVLCGPQPPARAVSSRDATMGDPGRRQDAPGSNENRRDGSQGLGVD